MLTQIKSTVQKVKVLNMLFTCRASLSSNLAIHHSRICDRKPAAQIQVTAAAVTTVITACRITMLLQSALHLTENPVPDPVDFMARNPDSDPAENFGSGISIIISD
jgi:hypothetical protein